ncbi:MAG: sugar phosphate isomerase/epimerase [Bryobacterales bacterium]|nr:sugar phosphate isomerase/epimerase [Bryobacterales bacterium]
MLLNRRQFLASSAAISTFPAAAASNIRFATGGYIWQNEIEEAIRATARFRFQGIEPYRPHILKYLDRPLELKKQLDAAGLSMATCSNGGSGMMVDFIDPAHTAQTIQDHVRFARDFIVPFGCRHFKINLGRRPSAPPSAAQLKTMADTLNRLGRETAKLGLKIAPHPHIWSPLERESELRAVMGWTDPELVFLVPDMAHWTLGGMNLMQVMTDYYPRIAGIHFKDTDAKYRGYRGPTPTQEQHREVNLYKNLGAGGVDFPAVMELLRSKGYRGWITLDLDPPRPGEGSIEEVLETNRKYLRERLAARI